MADITLWGFDGSTYVRTVKMILAEKGVTDYKQVQVNVLKGEPKSAEHLERHPFGKVPVLDHDGTRILETAAVANYLDAVLPGKSLVPSNPKDRARMDMVTSIIDSYGYNPIIGGVVAFHLFPDFVGGKNEEMHRQGIADGKKVVTEIMRIKGSSPWLAGDELSVADLYVAPVMAYVCMTPHKDEFMEIQGVREWWARVEGLESFKSTQPG